MLRAHGQTRGLRQILGGILVVASACLVSGCDSDTPTGNPDFLPNFDFPQAEGITVDTQVCVSLGDPCADDGLPCCEGVCADVGGSTPVCVIGADAGVDATVDSSTTDTTVDSASTDTTVDSTSTDTTVDSTSTDSTVDSTPTDSTVDTTSDTTVDTTVDSTVDAGVDATVDSSGMADGGCLMLGANCDPSNNLCCSGFCASAGGGGPICAEPLSDAAVADAPRDAGVDTTADASLDSTVDSTVDTTVDSTVDTTVDSTVDTTVDSTVDSVPDDSSVDSTFDTVPDDATVDSTFDTVPDDATVDTTFDTLPDDATVDTTFDTLPDDATVDTTFDTVPDDATVDTTFDTLPDDSTVDTTFDTVPDDSTVDTTFDTLPDDSTVDTTVDVLPDDSTVDTTADSTVDTVPDDSTVDTTADLYPTKTVECFDGIDNDGDGKIDSDDEECTGRLDDSEAHFGNAIPGDNVDCKEDCFFDGDSGSGNDNCLWDIQCDVLEPRATKCTFNGNTDPMNDTSCLNTPQTCLDFCEPITPNGCDCFGCCTMPNNTSGGTINIKLSESCDFTTLQTELAAGTLNNCKECTQTTACVNPCEHCEICIGKPTLPADCVGWTCDDGRTPCGDPTDPTSPPGTVLPAQCSAEVPNGYCLDGCCVSYEF